MKVAFITRSTLYKVRGGDTVQVTETARALAGKEITADIRLADERIDYEDYDLLHFFNITRPADMLVHIRKSHKPFVVTPIWIDYSQYDKHQRTGLAGSLFRLLSPGQTEYVKTMGRFITGRDALPSYDFAWKGQTGSIKEILCSADYLLVNSVDEYSDIAKRYKIRPPYEVVPNGVVAELYAKTEPTIKDETLVLCAARIEGIKNQFNLIRALNNTRFKLVLAGDPAPGQQAYYEKCLEIAMENTSFTGHLTQDDLLAYYAKAKVHVLPSWFELCGLSSLEAAAMGCSVVVSPNGYARNYFGHDAFYCDPADPASILRSVEQAAASAVNMNLVKKIKEQYTWQQAAEKIAAVYKKILPV